MRHLTMPQISCSLDEALSGPSLELVRRHFADCEECRARQSRLRRIDGVLLALISHQPGEAWFLAVAEEIDELVGAEASGSHAEPTRRAGPPPFQSLPPGTIQPDAMTWTQDLSEIPGLPKEPKHAAPPPAPVATAPVAATPAAATPAAPRPTPAAPAPVVSAPARPAPVAPAPAPPVPVAVAPAPPAPVAPAPAPPVPVAAAPAPPAPVAAAPAPPAPSSAPRWDAHAARVARLRRESSSKPRDTMFPILSGLVGGAIAGALIVAMMLSPRSPLRGSRSVSVPAAPTSAEPVASSDVRKAMRPDDGPEVTSVRPAPPSVEERAPSPAPTVAATAPRTESARTQPAPPPAPRIEPERPARSAASPERPEPTPPQSASRPQVVAPPAPADDEEWPLLCGEVVDDAGEPVAGAKVMLADLDLSVRTDRRGRFCVSAPAGDRTMSVVALGFGTLRQVVTVSPGTPELRLVLRAAP